MVVHGHPSTLAATVDLMALHTHSVSRSSGGKFVISDLPFLSTRKGIAEAMTAVGALITSGAHAVKLEGVDGHEDVVRQIVGSGVPVMGHIGLTPQSMHQLGGFRVQGRTMRMRPTSFARRTCSRTWAASRSSSSASPRNWPRGSRRS